MRTLPASAPLVELGALFVGALTAGCASRPNPRPPETPPNASADKKSAAADEKVTGRGPRRVPVGTLEFRKPAGDWEKQALPIGNGRLGAMVLGPPARAELQFNEDSLWTGGMNPAGKYDDDFGQYQAFGSLFIELDGLETASDYARVLDLPNGLHTTSFRGPDGTEYRQEAFASHPADLIAVRVHARGPSLLSGAVRLAGTHGETTTLSDAARSAPGNLSFAGSLANGLSYRAQVTVVADDAELTPRDGALHFDGASALTLHLAAATNYAADHEAGFRGESPEVRVRAPLGRAARTSYDELLAAHTADHRALYDRVSVDFGQSGDSQGSLPTDERVRSYEPGGDPELVATLFQYGRYLLMGSSRRPGLPANLQGLWNHSNTPPWHSDYHSNINVQMNYWLAEPANLSECHLPLFDMLDATRASARAATKASFGDEVPGFTYRTSHNIFGGQGWEWNLPSSAWYALHYYEHYAFTLDREFLRQRAWPYLREVSEFWLERLKRRADGTLVVPDGWSPEHGPREDGVTHDQELVAELFYATLAASDALAIRDPIVARVRDAHSRLSLPRIGRFGQLQEWETDRDDPDDDHRHTSHLVGVYPARRISVARTPELARAAEVSLRARGDSGDSRRSWTWPWRCALWARLGKSDCHRMIDGLIQYNLLPNLITTHPPLQLDGNFGITAGIAEMLVQSHAGEIALLPGVDRARLSSGSFRGLRARGGFEVSCEWARGTIKSAEIRATAAGSVRVRAPSLPSRVVDAQGRAPSTKKSDDGTLRFEAKAGERYRLFFD